MLADRAGASAVEFALVIPVLVLLMYGSFNVIAYFRTMNALERTATSMGEVISRCSAVSTQDLANFSVEAQEMVGGPPFSPLIDITGLAGAFIVTAIGNDSGTAPKIVWQKVFSSAVPALVSKFGTTGNTPANIGTYSLAQGQVLIGVEVYNNTVAWQFGAPYLPASSASTMYTMSIFLVRAPNPTNMETLTQSTSSLCGS